MGEYKIKIYDNGNIEVDDGISTTLIASSNLEEGLEILKKLLIGKHNIG